ncbi:hypothetical protein OG897_34080 [Streptomyces sp. NBC_00237]|uniref:hypothetical protein n=1 Tax=Streptomyces sp. NBC_00237 TaxID=2975687 RepID=UPI0022567C18|nr:hypothetical protein [Streptomyces sp. NBC_00237]MCX5206425.1 hypothetical protein [Streptomyces sp. NBC_00237]
MTVLGTAFDPAVNVVPEARVGSPAPVRWQVTKQLAPLDATLKGGPLGAAKSARPSVREGETRGPIWT